MSKAGGESRRKARIDLAAKSLAFARDGAAKWQMRVTGLHVFAVTGIGIVKGGHEADHDLIPWISLAALSLAAIMAFFASGSLAMARYWEGKLDVLLSRQQPFLHNKVGRFWQWPNALPLAIPMMVMGVAVAAPGFIFLIYETWQQHVLCVFLGVGLGIASACFSWNALVLPSLSPRRVARILDEERVQRERHKAERALKTRAAV